MKKRKHIPKCKPGQLMAYYGYADRHQGSPDLCTNNQPPAGRADARLLMWALDSKFEGTPFWKELEARGYDLGTMRFSIHKKPDAQR